MGFPEEGSYLVVKQREERKALPTTADAGLVEAESSGYLTSGVQLSFLSLRSNFVKGYGMVLAFYTCLVKTLGRKGQLPGRGDRQPGRAYVGSGGFGAGSRTGDEVSPVSGDAEG